MSEPMPAGFEWRWPDDSKKAHVFQKGDLRSMCLRWIFNGAPLRTQTLGETRGPDDCGECFRRLKKHIAPKKGAPRAS